MKSEFARAAKPKCNKEFEASDPGCRCPEDKPGREPGSWCPPKALGQPLGIRAAAALVGCSPWTLKYRLMRRGLPYFRAAASGKLIFYENQIVRWIERQQQGGK